MFLIMWILLLIAGVFIISLLIGGGINFTFLKVVLLFVIGIVCVVAIKKLFDLLKK